MDAPTVHALELPLHKPLALLPSSEPTLPKSMRELRRAREPDHFLDPPRRDWIVFEDFFLSHGLTLWDIRDSDGVEPMDTRIRAPDGFLFRHPDNLQGAPSFFMSMTSDLCPARSLDGRDVMIRIVSIGDDGAQHRTALERLATGYVASSFGNHTIPVLQWLMYHDITFAVFPMLSIRDPSSTWAWEDVRDVMDTVIQMLEAVAFCHSKLVAHRDLFNGNFLCNFGGYSEPDLLYSIEIGQRAKPFRSLFPFKIYLIDFECAICFEEDPQTHFVLGRPSQMEGTTYLRPIVPEMDIDEPYNPFKADVWQIGRCLIEIPINYGAISSDIADILERMTREDPSERPTATEALFEMRSAVKNLSVGLLGALPPYREDD